MTTAKIIVFNSEKCKGHRDCEKACSNVHHKNDLGGEHSAIQIQKSDAGFKMTDCNMCGLCIDMCPVQALKRLNNGTVVLKKNICIGCQACVRACPEGALELQEFELSELEETVYSYQGVCE